jgi:hypothetical protein
MPAPLTITVQTVDKTNMLLCGTLNAEWILEKIGTASGMLFDPLSVTNPAGAFRPAVGQALVISDPAGVPMWGGTFDSITETRFQQGINPYNIAFRATSYAQRLTKRYIKTAAYFLQTPGGIVLDLFANYIHDELLAVGSFVNINTGSVQPSFTASAASSQLTVSGASVWPATFANGTAVKLKTGGAGVYPAPLVSGVAYYVVGATATTCQLSLKAGGTPITLTTDGTPPNTLISIIPSVLYDYTSAQDALDALARFGNCAWWVDENAALHMQPRDAITAPFGLTSTSGNFRNLSVQYTRSEGPYRNREFWRVAWAAFAPDEFVAGGDGVLRAWDLDHPAIQIDSATVNLAPVTFGVLGVDSGKDFYYTPGGTRVVQDDAGATLQSGGTPLSYSVTAGTNKLTIASNPLINGAAVTLQEGGGGIPPAPLTVSPDVYIVVNATPTDVQLSETTGGPPITLTDTGTGSSHTITGGIDQLVIQYRSLGGNVVTAEDTTEQAARAAIEGSSGIYEHLTDSQDVDANGALAKANAALLAHGKIVRIVTYETDVPGLRPGQLQQIVLPEFNLNDYFLVNSVRAAYLLPWAMRYQIQVIDGSALDNYVDYFRGLLNKPSTTVITAASSAGTTSDESIVY